MDPTPGPAQDNCKNTIMCLRALAKHFSVVRTWVSVQRQTFCTEICLSALLWEDHKAFPAGLFPVSVHQTPNSHQGYKRPTETKVKCSCTSLYTAAKSLMLSGGSQSHTWSWFRKAPLTLPALLEPPRAAAVVLKDILNPWIPDLGLWEPFFSPASCWLKPNWLLVQAKSSPSCEQDLSIHIPTKAASS